MKRLHWFILIFSSVVLLLFVIGFALPERILVETETQIKRNPDAVLDYLADLRNWTEWSQINTDYDASLEIEYSGAPVGVGSVKTWEGENIGGGEIKITRITQMPVLHYMLKPKGTGLLFDCKFEIRAAEGNQASDVRWVVVTDLGMNPVMRYAGFILKGSLKSEIEKDIEKLRTVLEK
ncbi:MAG: SRPBCC family protein [Chitinophagales bacterium]